MRCAHPSETCKEIRRCQRPGHVKIARDFFDWLEFFDGHTVSFFFCIHHLFFCSFNFPRFVGLSLRVTMARSKASRESRGRPFCPKLGHYLNGQVTRVGHIHRYFLVFFSLFHPAGWNRPYVQIPVGGSCLFFFFCCCVVIVRVGRPVSYSTGPSAVNWRTTSLCASTSFIIITPPYHNPRRREPLSCPVSLINSRCPNRQRLRHLIKKRRRRYFDVFSFL